jgi:hypothetical protein
MTDLEAMNWLKNLHAFDLRKYRNNYQLSITDGGVFQGESILDCVIKARDHMDYAHKKDA